MSSGATDGMDRNGLKFDKDVGPTFSSFNAMPANSKKKYDYGWCFLMKLCDIYFVTLLTRGVLLYVSKDKTIFIWILHQLVHHHTA